MLNQLAKKFGPEWVLATVLPRVLELAGSENYLYRISCLSCFGALYESLDKEHIVAQLLPTIKKVSRVGCNIRDWHH